MTNAKLLKYAAAAAITLGASTFAQAAKLITFDKGNVSNGTFSDLITKKGTFTDILDFTISKKSNLSASLTSSAIKLKGSTDIDFSKILLIGPKKTYNVIFTNNGQDGLTDSASFSGLLAAGKYELSITGYSYGKASGFSGHIVSSAVPEPASWAMMIGGVGFVGGAMRRRSISAKIAFA